MSGVFEENKTSASAPGIEWTRRGGMRWGQRKWEWVG